MMSEDSEHELAGGEATQAPGVGAQLRAAREKRGLTIDQVAAQTRIGSRQLTKIEEGAWHELPGRIYAIGFAKTYAKAVGLDQDDVGQMVRAALGDDPAARGQSADFEPGDPARGPSGRLVWFSIFAIAMLVVGLFFAARVMMNPAATVPSLTENQAAEQAAAEAARGADGAAPARPVNPAGAVTLTAEGAVWLRLTDAAGTRLMEGELAAGQSFTIPASAAGPKLITARPDLLAISIGGRKVPKLSDVMRTVSDEPVDAATLLARPRPVATAAATALPNGNAPAANAATSATAAPAATPAMVD